MRKHVISISREFGSGGRLIGRQVAARLGIPCYDRTIIQRAAERSGLSRDFIAREEERAHSRLHLPHIPMGFGAAMFTHQAPSVGQQAFSAQAEVIRELADADSCVIVGRCSDYVLQDRPNCLKVFVHADLPSRVRRCTEEYRIPTDDLERRIRQIDQGRANYYSYYTGHQWGNMRRYDLTIDSAVAGIQGCTELIVCLAAASFDQLRQPGIV